MNDGHVSKPAPAVGRPQAAMRFIMLTVLIDMMSIGLIIPVLPALVGTFTGGSQAEQAWWTGALALSFGLANFFGSPIIGALSDQHGRRPVLLVGFCGLGLSFFVTGLATALWMLIVVRLFSGAMQSNLAVANAYVADITEPDQRAKRFGLLGAMFGLGFILGPTMGGLLGHINVHLPFFAAGTLALVNLLYGYFVLPESLPADRRKPFRWAAANPIASLSSLRKLQGVGRLVAVVACASLAQFTLHASWVLYTTFKFGWGPMENGWSLFAVGVSAALVQGVLLGRLLKRFGARRLAVIGLASSTLSFLAFGAVSEGWMMYVVIAFGLLGSTAASAIQSLFSSAADERSQGQTMGAMSSINSLAAVLAPLVATPLLGLVASLPKGDWRIGAPFYFCSALQLFALMLAWTHFRKHSGAQAPLPTPADTGSARA